MKKNLLIVYLSANWGQYNGDIANKHHYKHLKILIFFLLFGMFLKRFGSCMKKQFIRNSFILIMFVILLYSCSSTDINARKYYDDCKNNYLLSEWMSFDVSCMFFKDKKFSHALEPARVVIHNNPNYVSIIHPDYAILLNKDSIVYVNKYYEEIAVYHNTDTSKYDFYGMLSGDEVVII